MDCKTVNCEYSHTQKGGEKTHICLVLPYEEMWQRITLECLVMSCARLPSDCHLAFEQHPNWTSVQRLDSDNHR